MTKIDDPDTQAATRRLKKDATMPTRPPVDGPLHPNRTLVRLDPSKPKHRILRRLKLFGRQMALLPQARQVLQLLHQT